MLLIALPSIATAQPAGRAARSGHPSQVSPIPLPPIGLPLPPIGLPLPEIGLPLPSTGLPPATAAGHRTPRVNHPSTGTRRQRPSVVYIVPSYGLPLYGAPIATATAPALDSSAGIPQPQRVVGQLRLDIDPTGDQQQIYVDGNYVGTFKDFSGEMELDAGPHTVDIQATGYETLRIDVNIFRDRSIAYHGTLTPITPAAEPAAAATVPSTPPTIYVIPGCYVGNVPPTDVELPANCDVSRVVTTHP